MGLKLTYLLDFNIFYTFEFTINMKNNCRTWVKIELKVLVHESFCDLIIDFTGVDMIDSIGIGIIVAAHNSLQENGCLLIDLDSYEFL